MMDVELNILCLVILILSLSVLIGFRIIKSSDSQSGIIAWLWSIFSVAITVFITTTVSPIFRMFSIIIVLLVGMKIIVTSNANWKNKKDLSFGIWLLFCVGWVGMRPEVFSDKINGKALENKDLLITGIKGVSIGLLLILSTVYLVNLISLDITGPVLQLISVPLLIGVSLILHFGILNMLAGFWRAQGVNTKSLFNSPLKSKSLEEFWGKRWNIAFAEMTAVSIYRPISTSTNKAIALIVGFLFSGLLHELAISVPVNSGYGLPMLYFLIQGVAVIAEAALRKRERNLFTNPLFARAWTIFWILIPLPLLFHSAFLKQIILPIVGL